jgi:hypothetical protein
MSLHQHRQVLTSSYKQQSLKTSTEVIVKLSLNSCMMSAGHRDSVRLKKVRSGRLDSQSRGHIPFIWIIHANADLTIQEVSALAQTEVAGVSEHSIDGSSPTCRPPVFSSVS